MAKKTLQEISTEEDSASNAESLSSKKIGIFSSNWVESMQIAPNISEKIFKSFHIGTIVDDQDEVKRLFDLGAPIKVYAEYVY